MKLQRTVAILGLVLQATVTSAQAPGRSPIFRIETDEFWLNLHHFLYVLGRAEAKTTDSSRAAVAGAPADADRGLIGLTDEERRRWREAVTAYATGPSLKDAVFDDPLPAITGALSGVDEASTPSGRGIDSGVLAVLVRAAPVYRKAWWPSHREANRTWRSSLQALVDKHGRMILGFITGAYGMPWPAAGYPVHLSAYANWAGAYSTSGDLLVVSTEDASIRGLYGLEIVFHEGMHQWDDQIDTALRDQARKIAKEVPANLSHAMIFFTAGEAVRRVAPEHVPYADKFGVWQRGMMALRAAILDTWKPYLDGRGTRDQALAALISAAADSRR
jgi:hypothetical protein